MLIANNWDDFEVLDAGNGEKLERWGEFILRRPDPQAIWNKSNLVLWDKADAIYHRSKSGGGEWEFIKRVPEQWSVKYRNLDFVIKPTSFKHTGLFPEQAVNWDWIDKKIKDSKISFPKVLNLFGYTGGATVAALAAGAEVVHVDASKGMIEIAKQNVSKSGLDGKPVRFFVDDVVKLVQREIRRGNKYHGIIMDPPSFGRGTSGEVWEIEKSLNELVGLCNEILEEKPLFILVNSYASEISRYAIENILKDKLPKGKISSDELGLPIKNREDMNLPCGSTIRCEF
ncbi:MAG: class I SAM-dependent methyltransferase [Candidatus Dojkabacteria bacterium]